MTTDDATHHNLIKTNIPRVGCECLGFWIHQRLLDDAHKVRFEESFAPLWNAVCLGQDSFAVQCAVFPNLSLNCVF